MDELLHWIGVLLLMFFHWLWSIKLWIFVGIWFIWLQWAVKDTMRSAVQDALNKTVVPLLEDISAKLHENEDEDD